MSEQPRAIESLLQRTHPSPTSPRYNRQAVSQASSVMASRTLFEVEVQKDGGSAGDKTTQCSFTYTVRIPSASINLATGLTPTRARPSAGMLAAIAESPSWGIGWAYIDAAGQLQLWDANETLAQEACP